MDWIGRRFQKVEFWFPFLVLLILLYLMYLAIDFHPRARLFPLMVGSFGVAVTVIELFLQLKAEKNGIAPEKGKKKELKPVFWRVLFLTIIYLFAVQIIGYIISTFFFTVVCMRILGAKSWFFILVVALSTAAAIYFIFGYWLLIPMPPGLFR